MKKDEFSACLRHSLSTMWGGGRDGVPSPSEFTALPARNAHSGYRLSISGSSMLRFRALKLMPTNVTGRLPPLYASA